MAINIKQDLAPLPPVRVIARIDDAIDHEKSDMAEYRKTGDENKLLFLEGKLPTIFVCNFNHGTKETKQINNAMLLARDENNNPTLAYGSWAQAIVKMSLKEIENPPYVLEDEKLVLRKDGFGYVHDEMLGKLDKMGIIDDIFQAYMRVQKDSPGATTVKNS